MQTSIKHIFFILGAYLIYSLTSLCSKTAAAYDFLSLPYCLWLGGAVLVMGIYAILWQQILKRVQLTTAYLFKGVTIIYTMLIAFFVFGESITWNNILGAIIIITGISLFNTQTES